MKFLETHRQDLLKTFQANDITKEDFHFIKRKGRIITHHRTTKAEFSYFLKKDRRQPISIDLLDEPPKYEISLDGKKELVDSWDEVLCKLQDWLSHLLK